ncbi:MAG TPA: zinc-binding dehydrogenase [Candidatus Limnocylindrales bacterium]|nr:zinc-binding dehydrogenase [Candidatus Limnocylindrales bacterium]
MRAARLVSPGRWSVERVARPAIAPGQVLVRLEGCGVCSSSLPVWEGRPWFEYPLAHGAPGHEGWGRVEAVGSQASGLVRGDRVALLSYAAFAEFEAVDAKATVKLPAALDAMPFPGEALGCGLNVWARADIRPGHTVAVVGAGFLGALLVRLASAEGARVLAISRRPFSRSLASRMGAGEAFDLDEATVPRVLEATSGRGCDRVIEATGLQQPLDVAGAIVATRGRLVIAGYHQDGLRHVDMQSWNWRGIDVVNAHERERDAYMAGITRAVDAVCAGLLDPRPLITHVFPLERIGEALDHTRTRPQGFVKAIVTMGGAAADARPS